jgi:methyl-accepting chemotaxis protein
MINVLLKKTILTAMILALALAVLPVSSVLAAEENPPAQGELSVQRLERVWRRELRAYERIGKAFDQSGAMLEKAQALIDKAAENGRDVSALQAALDTFDAAIQSARPQYDELAGIIDAHAGFDADGKVTDIEQARSTVRELGAALKEVKSAMGGTGKAFREALRAFREANRPPEPSAERDS